MSEETSQTQDSNSSQGNGTPPKEPIPLQRLIFYGIVIAVFIFSVVLYCRTFYKEYPTTVRGGELLTDIPRFSPRKSPAPSPGSSLSPIATPSTKPININTATVEQLDNLPGIGRKRAEDIIKYRTTHGPFQRPEDLLKVEGIGDKTLEKLKPSISVSN